jgi:hypothetical protein
MNNRYEFIDNSDGTWIFIKFKYAIIDKTTSKEVMSGNNLSIMKAAYLEYRKMNHNYIIEIVHPSKIIMSEKANVSEIEGIREAVENDIGLGCIIVDKQYRIADGFHRVRIAHKLDELIKIVRPK